MYSHLLMLLPLFVQDGQEKQESSPSLPPPVAVAVRLGAQLSPRFNFAGGLDLELNRLSIGPGWFSRIDTEVLLEPANDGLFAELNSTEAVTFNQIYAPYYRTHQRRVAYAGFGIGYYNSSVRENRASLFGYGYHSVGHFGGKIFFGSQFTSTTSAELGVHFPGIGSTLLTAQLRLKL